MKKYLSLAFLFLILSAVLPTYAADKESAYDRVMQTGELRCGYFSWKPSFIKDPNTGAMSGIFHDYMEEMGKALKLKIVWAEEIGLGDYPAALKSGRIDAMCSSLYVTSERARVTDFITPAYYLPLHAYARTNDSRFKNFTPEKFNDPKYSVVILEGGVTSILQHVYFPNAKVYELPQLSNPSELFTSLAQGKGDFLLYDLFTFEDYNAHNPNKLQRVTTTPIKVFPLAIAVDKNQDALREMLDTATMDVHLSGKMAQIISKYEIYPHSILQMAMPYKQ
jgi:ABC-type amino acid transport substrate-binding protein